LFFSTNRPVSYDVKYFPYQRGEPIIEKEIQYAEFPDIVASRTSLFAVNKELIIKCEMPDKDIAEMLHIGRNHPIIKISQKYYDENNIPLAIGYIYMNSTYFEIKGESIGCRSQLNLT
jgi:GntR family transcriptional regulator